MKTKILEILKSRMNEADIHGMEVLAIDINYIGALSEELDALFALREVVKSFTAEKVVNELEDCETLDDAIMFFKEQI